MVVNHNWKSFNQLQLIISIISVIISIIIEKNRQRRKHAKYHNFVLVRVYCVSVVTIERKLHLNRYSDYWYISLIINFKNIKGH